MFLVSACLAGFNCRYNGGNCATKIVQDLVNDGMAMPICPEQLAGLPTPRESCEMKIDMCGSKRILDKYGRDYTEEFTKGAELTLAIARTIGAKEAILKSKSPSCGCGLIYDGTFSGEVIEGDGLVAELLKKNGIYVRTESGQ
ncbi:MAG: DUF523 domain-containing protein [Alphaproteobacteria bacterium]|nr:DUF523 domain-containing protein [Alphaproteobacteria bacterium]